MHPRMGTPNRIAPQDSQSDGIQEIIEALVQEEGDEGGSSLSVCLGFRV